MVQEQFSEELQNPYLSGQTMAGYVPPAPRVHICHPPTHVHRKRGVRLQSSCPKET